MRKIILTNGSVIDLDAYQKINGLSDESFGKYFSFADTKLFCDGEILLAEPLLVLLDAFRELVGKPVTINAGYRSESYQTELKKT